jgi:hypothetical protein
LVRSKRIVAALLILCASCKPQPKKPAAVSIATAPQTRATVLTIETTILPSNKKIVHSLTIANDRARSGDELDRWRLFDLKANTVTFVDEINKTYRTEPIASLVKQHRAALAAAIPAYIPREQVAASGGNRHPLGRLHAHAVGRRASAHPAAALLVDGGERSVVVAVRADDEGGGRGAAERARISDERSRRDGGRRKEARRRSERREGGAEERRRELAERA